MSEGRRGGERRQPTSTTRRHPATGTSNRRRAEGTRPSLGPSTRARRSSLCSGSKARRWGIRGGIAVGQTCASGRNRHRDRNGWTLRGSPRGTASARERACHVRKGRRSRPPSLRGSRTRVWLLARRYVVAEVGRRRLASNKLGKRAPKRAAGSSERGPSSERTSAGDTVGGRVERRDESRVGLTAKAGEDRPKTQGGERSPFNGSHVAKSGERVAGPGL